MAGWWRTGRPPSLRTGVELAAAWLYRALASSMLTSGCWRRVLCTVQCEARASSASVRCGGTPPGTVIRSRTAPTRAGLSAPYRGTVAFVDPIGHRYLDDPVAREEGGTPAIVESIRAGLVFTLKQAVGTDLIAAREEQLWRHVLRRWAGSPGIEVLGSHQAARLAVISFRIRHGTRYLHHNFVVALLNDLFGIQARGGCSCAGPYGHRLLAIGPARSHAPREEIGHGCDGIKPGWTRVNLNYFISRPPPGTLPPPSS